MAKSSRDTAGGCIQYDVGGRKGVHRIRWWGTDPKTGVYRRMSKTVHGTRKDAKLERARLVLEHSQDRPCPTVGEVWERWVLPQYERRLEEGEISVQTLSMYMGSWKRHAAPRWADVPVDAAKPLEVQQWLDTLKYSEAESAMKVVRPIFDAAVRYGLVRSNPMREKYLMPSKTTISRRDKGIWSLAELESVWRAAYGRWFEPAFILAAFGGCRVGEAMGPLAAEVELLDVGGVPIASVAIERQVPNRGKVMAAGLKTPQSRRRAVVAGKAAMRLAGLSNDGRTYLTDDGNGSWVPQDRLVKAWGPALEAGGAEVHPFRNLRNSWETNMRWALRLPPWIVEPMMGHAGQGVTGQYYDRPQAEMFAEALADAYRSNPYDSGWSIGGV